MKSNNQYSWYILLSTCLSIFIMLSSSTEMISWSVWAQNLTPGMSLIAVKIFNNSSIARLIVCILGGLFTIIYGYNKLSMKQMMWFVTVILILLLSANFLGYEQIKGFHFLIILFLVVLQIPIYADLYLFSKEYTYRTLTTSELLKLSSFWMMVVLGFGMISFYFHFEHPQQLLPVNFLKYGMKSQLYPHLLHFSVLGNFTILTIFLFFVSKRISALFDSSYAKLTAEIVVFLLFISFIIRGVFSELYHEIEITESRYILNLLPIYIPVIFTPLILNFTLKHDDNRKKSVFNTPFLVMYLIGSFPIRLFIRLLPERLDSSKVWNIALLALSAVYFMFTVFIFRGLIFDPWYTILSPIKGLVYAISVWVATILIAAAVAQSRWYSTRISWMTSFSIILLVLISSVWIPRSFHDNPGLKGLLVQYSESVKISLDGLKTFYPEFINSSILKAGQNARVNTTYSISPAPMDLSGGKPYILNDSTSYIYVMADAMRGDFYEGKFTKYDSLYPFMKEWIDNECIWFPHGYSQSNGSYLGIPALFGSHGNRSVLKSSAKHENRFFQLLKHDGIEDIYSIDGNSLHNIYPDDIQITSLGKVPDDFGAYDRNVTAMELLERLKIGYRNRANRKPFFAYLLLMDTHNDYSRKQGFINYGNKPIDLYAHNIHYVDHFMQELVKWLKKVNQYQNTVIVFTSDHGEEFKEHESTLHGHNFFEEVMRVPVIMKIPNVMAKIIDKPILNSDIFPTIATLRGYDIKTHYNHEHLGIDQSRIILDGDTNQGTTRDMLFISSQNTKHALFRDGRYKMIYWPKYESFVFYDLKSDQMEYDNQIEENQNLAKKMHSKMLKLINKTSGETYLNSWPNDF